MLCTKISKGKCCTINKSNETKITIYSLHAHNEKGNFFKFEVLKDIYLSYYQRKEHITWNKPAVVRKQLLVDKSQHSLCRFVL